ncbi:MAG: FAD-dependent 5-carboxymethylaminomethyl-2-thiouridine(34) oxidoreductase MnmC [Ramlibacter sp.]
MDFRPAWAARRQWRVLQGGWNDGAEFLAAWQAWRGDAQRPGRLHYVALDAAPRASGRWSGLTPGFHRFPFEDGRVLLTLCVGERAAMLREQAFRADAIVLDELAPATLKALPRLCRHDTLLACDGPVTAPATELTGAGFVVERSGPGGLLARYAPAWEVKGRAQAEAQPPRDAVVIGAGLAGAAIACSLARRGCSVEVLDAAHEPAAGASALPAGLMAPHQSPDDNLLSRLSRSGVRTTWQECERLLAPGRDWAPTGVLEHRRGDRRSPPALGAALDPWTRVATDGERAAAGLPAGERAWWHATAGWVRPAALVRAWLATPGVRFRGGCAVESVARDGDGWCVFGADGPLARARIVVVAAAGGSPALLAGRVAVHPVRGQVSWRLRAADDVLPAMPVNGHGHFLPDLPLAAGRSWLTGSTYGRADADAQARDEDQWANLERLRALLPQAAASVEPHFRDGSVGAWSGVRWASSDRRPLAGEVEEGLWVGTAMGSRGLTFAALCGEWIAARLFGEPWPLEARLAQALDVVRSRAAHPTNTGSR